MNILESALTQVASTLAGTDADWALIGGLAVSVRAEPRTTRDVDLAVAVREDRQAETLVKYFQAAGYRLREGGGVLENLATGRLAMVRLVPPHGDEDGVVIDVLFGSSGIEPEIVAAAQAVEVFPGLFLPVATVAHLLALKLLAGRAKDIADATALVSVAGPAEIDATRAACRLIEARHCNRGRDLEGILTRLLAGQPIEVVG